MTKYTNPYERIQLYHSWFINNEDLCLTEEFDSGVSMKFISELSGIPLNIIRKDICMLFKWQSNIFSDDKLLDNGENLNISSFLSFPEELLESNITLNNHYEDIEIGDYSIEFENYILAGKLDNDPICLLKNTSNNNNIKLWVTIEEYEALNEYQVLEKTSIEYEKAFRIKDSYRFNHEYVELTEKLLILSEAIKNGTSVELAYKKTGKNIQSFLVKPLRIIYDTTENLYVLLSTTGKDITTYRFEYIIKVYSSDTIIDSSKVEEKINKIQPLVWGNDFNTKPIGPVKVRFYNEGNVWKKVKKEFENRDSSCLYEEDGFLYFESYEIYGGNKGANFLRWIRSFGSSAIIISPTELRTRMIESYQRRLQ